MRWFSGELFQVPGPWGVPIVVMRSVLILPPLLTLVAWSQGPFAGLWIWLALTVAVVAHELGHAGAAVWSKVPVLKIQINAFSGLCFYAASATPRQREGIILAGPLVNVAFWLVGSAALLLPMPESLAQALEVFARLNLILAILNLVPTMPLDGGQFLRCFMQRWCSEEEANKITGTTGLITSLLWLPLFVLALIYFNFFLFIWAATSLHWRMMRHGRIEKEAPVAAPEPEPAAAEPGLMGKFGLTRDGQVERPAVGLEGGPGRA